MLPPRAHARTHARTGMLAYPTPCAACCLPTYLPCRQVDQSGDPCFIGTQPVNGQGSTSFPTSLFYAKNNGGLCGAVSVRTYNYPWASPSYFVSKTGAPLCMVMPLNSFGIYRGNTILDNYNLGDGNNKYPQARRYVVRMPTLRPALPLPPPTDASSRGAALDHRA